MNFIGGLGLKVQLQYFKWKKTIIKPCFTEKRTKKDLALKVYKLGWLLCFAIVQCK